MEQATHTASRRAPRRHAHIVFAAAALAALAGIAGAQTFEVASIKLNKDRRGPMTSMESMFYRLPATGVVPNGRLRLTAMTARALIELAFDLRHFQVVGGPSWVNDDRYDVDAKAAEGMVTYQQMRPMLQALLADRFQLRVRSEARTARGYEIVPARSGLKIRATPAGGCYDPRAASGPAPVLGGPLIQCDGVRRRILTTPPDRVDRIEAVAVRMSRLVDFIVDDVDRPVVDRTGMTEPFDFVLDFAPNVATSDYLGPSTLRDPAVSAAAVPISTALLEQLGIQLRSTDVPVETIVIERIERPTEN
jgi:uncharacterized protein (TIGR03435 family)